MNRTPNGERRVTKSFKVLPSLWEAFQRLVPKRKRGEVLETAIRSAVKAHETGEASDGS